MTGGPAIDEDPHNAGERRGVSIFAGKSKVRAANFGKKDFLFRDHTRSKMTAVEVGVWKMHGRTKKHEKWNEDASTYDTKSHVQEIVVLSCSTALCLLSVPESGKCK